MQNVKLKEHVMNVDFILKIMSVVMDMFKVKIEYLLNKKYEKYKEEDSQCCYILPN